MFEFINFVLLVVYGLFLLKLTSMVWIDYKLEGERSMYVFWFCMWLVYFFLFGRFLYVFIIGG